MMRRVGLIGAADMQTYPAMNETALRQELHPAGSRAAVAEIALAV
jgi:hypothetical protein